MASNTQVLKCRRRHTKKKMGRKHKKYLAKNGTTPSSAIIFGDVKESSIEKTTE